MSTTAILPIHALQGGRLVRYASGTGYLIHDLRVPGLVDVVPPRTPRLRVPVECLTVTLFEGEACPSPYGDLTTGLRGDRWLVVARDGGEVADAELVMEAERVRDFLFRLLQVVAHDAWVAGGAA